MPAGVNTAGQWPAAINEILRQWMPREGRACCVAASPDFDIPAADRSRIAGAVPHRQAEFIAGRWCAYTALEQLGVTARSLPSGALGGPVWPVGTAGSITHESGICAAVAVRSSAIRGIGIDLFDQRHKSDMQEIAYLVLAPEEMPFLGSCEDSIRFIQLSFSLKEAVVKAVSSTAGRFLDMREIRLSIEEGAFSAELACFGERMGQVAGKWSRIGPFFLTFAVLGA